MYAAKIAIYARRNGNRTGVRVKGCAPRTRERNMQVNILYLDSTPHRLSDADEAAARVLHRLRDKQQQSQPQCIECGTRVTPLWRHVYSAVQRRRICYCNACGIRRWRQAHRHDVS